MKRVRLLARQCKCMLLIKYHRLRQAHHTAYVAYRSQISRDLISAEFTYIGQGALIGPNVSIGAYTMLGPRVMCLGDDHRYDLPSVPIIFSGRPTLRATKIGRDVWIGAGAVVLAGVEIGDGAIVAAGTVVTKSISPCEIHVGVPNRKIADRFPTSEQRDLHMEYLRKPPKMGDFCQRL